jgi:osmotically-inducible protein OsmY
MKGSTSTMNKDVVMIDSTTSLELARQALSDSPIYDLRDITVEESGDDLLLVGRVESFYHKQMAQELVRHLVGGIRLINSIDVED